MNRFEHGSLRDKVALCHLSEVETIPKDSNKIQGRTVFLTPVPEVLLTSTH